MNDITANRMLKDLKRNYDLKVFNFEKTLLAIRIPKAEIAQFDDNDEKIITEMLHTYMDLIQVEGPKHAYILADRSYIIVDTNEIMSKIYEKKSFVTSDVAKKHVEEPVKEPDENILLKIIKITPHTPIHHIPIYTAPVSESPEFNAPIYQIPINREIEITVRQEKKNDSDKKSDETVIREILSDFARTKKKRVISTQTKSGRRAEVLTKGKRGRYVRYRLPDGKVTDIAIAPTIRAAALHAQDGRISVLKSDYREKIRRRRICTLINIVLDTSGSMNEIDKVDITRSVIVALLKDAYQRRDKVSLVTYSGRRAELVLPFTSSVERAKRYLETIPFGGTTPMASGILSGLHILHNEIMKDPSTIPIMILVTDGESNVPLEVGGNIRRELSLVLKYVINEGIHILAVDMSKKGSPLTKEISEITGGRYFHPARLSKESLYKVISDERDDVSYFANV